MQVSRLVFACVVCAACVTPDYVIGQVEPSTSLSSNFAQLVESTVESHPRVLAARAVLDAASAAESAAGRPLHNPELSLDAESADVDTYTVGISQTIDWGNKRSVKKEVAAARRQSIAADYLATRWHVSVELLKLLTQYQTSATNLTLANTQMDLMADFSRLASRRFEAGDLSQVALDTARLAAVEAKINRAKVSANLAQAEQSLRSIAPGIPPTNWPLLPESVPTVPDDGLELDSVADQLPEVRAAHHRLLGAEVAIELSRREQRLDPTISLVAGSEDDEPLVGLNFSIPLRIRNRYTDELRIAVAEHLQAQYVFDDTRLRTRTRLRAAVESYKHLRSAWQEWDEIGDSSLTRQSSQLQQMWDVGELSATEYMVQLQQVLNVQASALDLRQTLWIAWFDWLLNSGRVEAWLSDVQRISPQNTGNK